ncbi:MAG TPA: hypothetical protein DCP28_08985 [Cytophagales bacterium]|nr:hypothetical protein [Cytophagales bacterium]
MPNSVGSVQVSVSLLVRDEFGNISTQYGSIWVTITSSTLSTPGFISGNYLTCNGATTRFSVAAVSGASSYQWTVPSGWTLAPGASNPSASPFIDLVAPATSYGSSTVRVRALSGSSCNNNSALRSRTVLYGKEVGTINGPSTLTAYQTNMFYGLNVNSSVTNVTWSVPNNGWYGYTDGDNYRLFVNNQSGILTAEYKSCNQNVRIEKYITVTTGGGGGLPIGFRGANPESELGLVDITLFPNPAVDYVEIQANAPIESVRVFTLEGREMLSESNVDANERISLKGLAKGIYLVQVNTATEQSVKQLVIE